MATTRRWWSRAILIGSVIAVAMLLVGALGSKFGLWTFGIGFMFLGSGALLALIGVIGGIAAVIAVFRKDLRNDLSAVLIGTAVCVAIVGFFGMQFVKASGVPPIHNISTDVADPPAFTTIVELRGKDSNPLEYDAAKLADAQQKAYPWVRPLESPMTPQQSFDRAAGVLKDMNVEVVNSDPANGMIEGTVTTFWFGFKDDVVVRIRPEGTGSRIDLRSVSRVGQSDLGLNARRIGDFLTRFAS